MLEVSSLEDASATVEELIADGACFEAIEAEIERFGWLTDEEKSALWLLAWAEATTPEARRLIMLAPLLNGG